MPSTTRQLRARRDAFQKAIGAFNRSEPKEKCPTPQIPVKLGEKVEMVSLLANKKENDPSEWPSTSEYTPIENNLAGDALPESTKRAITEGLKGHNKITCGCRAGVDCSTNPNCRCFQAAQKLTTLGGGQILKYGCPMKFKGKEVGKFWDDPKFACGEECGCEGKCGLNALQKMDEQKFICRRENEKGFCLFTLKDIKKGDPILSFNGVMDGYRAIIANRSCEQYALSSISYDRKLAKWIRESGLFSKEYTALLRTAYNTKLWVNPLEKGNAARFLSHGCQSSVRMLRVFQGGFSPADLRIIMFASQNIQAGSELTFDYGEDYKLSFLDQSCLCEKCLRRRRRIPSGSRAQVIPAVQTVPAARRNLRRRIKVEAVEPVDQVATEPPRTRPRLIKKEEVADDEEDNVEVAPVRMFTRQMAQKVKEEREEQAKQEEQKAVVAPRPRRYVKKEESTEGYGDEQVAVVAPVNHRYPRRVKEEAVDDEYEAQAVRPTRNAAPNRFTPDD